MCNCIFKFFQFTRAPKKSTSPNAKIIMLTTTEKMATEALAGAF